MTNTEILTKAIQKNCRCGRGPITSPSNYRCTECNRERMAEARLQNPELFRQRSATWKQANKSRMSEINARSRLKLKIDALDAYGGRTCSCCGVVELAFLTIDHIEKDGAIHRKSTGGGNSFYFWLRKNGYPDLPLRVLCFNCNVASYRGPCPHQVIAEDPSKYLGKHLDG